MLSAMETLPADVLPRPITDGASGALDSDGAGDSAPAACADKDSDSGVNSDADVKPRVDSDAKPRADAKSNVDADSRVKSDAAPVLNGAIASPARDSAAPPLAIPDSDSGGEERRSSLTRSEADVSARSELDEAPDEALDEAPDEVELRLSESEAGEQDSSLQLTDDEDRLLRDDNEMDPSPTKATAAGSPHPSNPAEPSNNLVKAATSASPGHPSNPSNPDTPDEAETSADPVDLPDDMFESAAALNAAEEEEDRARREANQRALAALEASDSMDGCGDSMDVLEADSMDASDVGVGAITVCNDEATMDGVTNSMDGVTDSMDGHEAADTMDVQEVSDSNDACDVEAVEVGDSPEAVQAGDSPVAIETGDSLDAVEAGDSLDAVETGDSSSPAADSAAQTDPEASLSAVLAGAIDDPDDPDDPFDPGEPPDDPDDPGDPAGSAPPAGSRKRAGSPPVVPEASKVRRLEPRPFIEVKKVKLSEDNMRLLQESNERDRRRLEESSAATAAAAAPVNGVKTSLMQRVRQLSRQDLETLVLEKMCDSIASRSVIGDMKKSAEKHVIAAERFQKKITYLQKQVGDLHLVVRKLSAELKSRRSPSYPVKITRTVGLQVTLAKSVPPLTSRPRPAAGTLGGSPGTPGTPATNGVLRTQLSSPGRPRQPVHAVRLTTSGQGQLLRPPLVSAPGAGTVRRGPGRPPGSTNLPAGSTVALLPVVRTVLPLSSVPLAGVTSPQRPTAAPATPGSPAAPQKTTAILQKRPLYTTLGRPRGGRTPRQPSGGAASASSASSASSADVVDLTDDDDTRKPAGRGGVAGSPQRPAAITTVTAVSRPVGASPLRGRPLVHPAPFPVTPPNPAVHTGQLLPPPPLLKVTRRANGIVLSWTMDLTPRHATVVSYHLFAYQESGPVNLRSNPWKKVGDVKALPLPMACTLTQFQEGHKYHFAVRAEDSFRRRGPFSNPSSIALLGGQS